MQNDHLPLALALDPDVQLALGGGGSNAQGIAALNRKLALLTDASSGAALYVMDLDGLTIAASNWDQDGSFLGQNYAYRSYFQLALEAGRAAFYAIGATTDRAGYFLSQAVVVEGEPIGVTVVKVEFDDVEAVWADAEETVIVTDANDIVFLSSKPEWRYRAVSPLSEDAQDEIARTRQYAGRELLPMPIEVVDERGGAAHVRVDAQPAVLLSQSSPLADLGWVVHQLSGTEALELARRDGALIGGGTTALFLALAFVFFQRQRMLSEEREARLLLEDRVAARTHELTQANRQLSGEVEVRQRAEMDLRAAQADLVQAEKLAALGHMSAAIAHEVNQPLSAIRMSAESARMLLQRGDPDEAASTMSRISDLAARAAAITSHLRAFARKGGPQARIAFPVDVALQKALALSAERIASDGIRLELDLQPVRAMGSPLPFEQVAANLIQNAIDAVADVASPCVTISARDVSGRAVVTVSDNGPGFGGEALGKGFDPFYTTKDIGEGMGLGLSIAYGIVRDFSGSIRIDNTERGGARVTVELPSPPADATRGMLATDDRGPVRRR